jgi:hypothetical protein
MEILEAGAFTMGDLVTKATIGVAQNARKNRTFIVSNTCELCNVSKVVFQCRNGNLLGENFSTFYWTLSQGARALRG